MQGQAAWDPYSSKMFISALVLFSTMLGTVSSKCLFEVESSGGQCWAVSQLSDGELIRRERGHGPNFGMTQQLEDAKQHREHSQRGTQGLCEAHSASCSSATKLMPASNICEAGRRAQRTLAKSQQEPGAILSGWCSTTEMEVLNSVFSTKTHTKCIVRM